MPRDGEGGLCYEIDEHLVHVRVHWVVRKRKRRLGSGD